MLILTKFSIVANKEHKEQINHTFHINLIGMNACKTDTIFTMGHKLPSLRGLGDRAGTLIWVVSCHSVAENAEQLANISFM